MTMDLSRLGRTLGITIGVAAGVAGLGAWAALRRPLPRNAGDTVLAGLRGKVQIMRDGSGVPHIYAAHNEDLFRGLGYVHAQDRLWQMELNRRTGHGQLAAIFGPVALSSDRFVRTLGFSRVAHQEVALLDDETRTLVESYLGGINSFVEANAGRLPLEFSLLRFSPRPWTVADVLVWPKMMALNLCGNWTTELLNARLLAAVGAERFDQLVPTYPEAGPITLPEGLHYASTIGEGALRAAAEAAPFISNSSPQGSNAWVVGPQRSASGQPILANDPHLNISLPLVWYEVHLEGGDYAVAGATFPGLPAVVIGHNQHIAWGVTNSMTDVQDLYVERLHPEGKLAYEWQSEWRDLEIVREEIEIKGQTEVHIEEVWLTHHGPIIDRIAAPEASPLRPGAPGLPPSEALALRWTALEPAPETLRAGLAIDRARNWDEFRAALADWRAPAQNFVYADVEGHVGYALSGLHPIRAQGDGRLPVPGWQGAYEWQGYIPHTALPAALDPAEGFVATANNRITGTSYPYANQLHGDYLNPYRVQRIREQILATAQHDAASFGRMHRDVRSLPGLELARLLRDLPLDDPFETQVRDLLTSWDGELTPESVGGSIYDALRYHLERQAYAELGDLLSAPTRLGAFGEVPGNALMSRAFPHILARIAAAPGPTRADPWLGESCTWNQVLHEAFALAVQELRIELGPDLATWTYGRVHSLTLRHPLGNIPALAPIFNRGPWPTGGDLDTVAMGYIPRDSGASPVYQAPSVRHIFVVGDWDASQFVLPSGQSGHPASPHYTDQNEPWRNGGYRPLPWSRAAVEAATVATLTLVPEPY